MQLLVGKINVYQEGGEDVGSDQPVLSGHRALLEYLHRAALKLELANLERVR